jgi:hypothetical protein
MGDKVNWGNVAKNAGMSAVGSFLPNLAGGALQGITGGISPYMNDIMKYLNMARQGYGIYNQVKGHG